MKTKDEVEVLKKQWLEDPCFELDEVEGFEEYKAELTEFQTITRGKAYHERYQKELVLAQKWGQRGDGEFGKRMMLLLERIDVLEERVHFLEGIRANIDSR